VLRAATADAWRFLGQPHEAGIVEAGARADLLLVATDPLIAPLPLVPEGVMVRGRWLPHDDLAARLADVARRSALPDDPWASQPSLTTDGTIAYEARYDTALAGTRVGAERLVVGKARGVRTVAGQITDPGPDLEVTYQLGRDHAAVSATYHTMTATVAGKLTGHELVVTATDLTGKPMSLRAPVPADAVLLGPGIGGTLALVDKLAGMKPGTRRELRSIELGYYPRIAIVSARHQIERRPDTGGHRVFRVTTTRGDAMVTSELVTDRDGHIVKRTDGAPVDTITTRRAP
jgi:hypothetical protein